MNNSQKSHISNADSHYSHYSHYTQSTNQQGPESIQDKQPFAFLQNEEKPHHSFFSKNGLEKDIIQVLEAEPDVCLVVFYALYLVLFPQIESQPDIFFKYAWRKFIGFAGVKGILCPPERLIPYRELENIKIAFAQTEGENKFFEDLDQVLSSISDLKEKIKEYSSQILHKEEIMASLDLVQEFYLGFRRKIKALVQDILKKEQANISYASESDVLKNLFEPKAVVMSDMFTAYWAYRIPRGKAQKLVLLDGNISNGLVVPLPESTEEPLVFFKVNGIQPEKAFMVDSLFRHFNIPIPGAGLIVLTDVCEANPESFFTVQASEAVPGESSFKAFEDPETVFDLEAYASQAIGALLINPSHSSMKDYQYSPMYRTLIPLENNKIFQPELIGDFDNKIVKVKSLLYLLPQIDLPIPETTKTFFTTFDPELTIFSWLKELYGKNQDSQMLFTRLGFQRTRCVYQNLLHESETPSLKICLKEPVNLGPFPQIFVSQEVLNGLAEKLEIISTALGSNRSISTQDLFELISRILGKYYRKLRLEFSSPKEAFEALGGVEKDGLDYSYISSVLDLLEFGSMWDVIGLDENLAPEAFLKEYKELLASEQNLLPLDKFIRRHQERRKKNVQNTHIAVKELKLLIQEGLTNSGSLRGIVDFRYYLLKMTVENGYLLKEIEELFSSLPQPELKWLFTLEKYFMRPEDSGAKDSSLDVLGAFMKQRKFTTNEKIQNSNGELPADILSRSDSLSHSRLKSLF